MVDVEFGNPCASATVNVPREYEPQGHFETWLSRLQRPPKREDFEGVATHTLKPGHTYLVQVVPVLNGVDNRLSLGFLKSEKGLLLGASGIAFLHEACKDIFPYGAWTLSLDEGDRLPQDVLQKHRVPGFFHGTVDLFGTWALEVTCRIPLSYILLVRETESPPQSP